MTTALKLVKDDTKGSLYHTSEPLFSVECKEKRGTVVRNVYLATFTPEFLRDMWEKQKRFRTLMGREIHTFEQFVDFFVTKVGDKITPNGVCLVVDDLVGIFWISDINYPGYCEVHYTFFDRVLNGRSDLAKRAIKYIFDLWQINCMYVQVAAYADGPLQFVQGLGFKREGRLRNRSFYREKYYDVISFSLLKEELDECVRQEVNN
jgi:RimJ/RimL family protein N-acetyltransferase